MAELNDTRDVYQPNNNVYKYTIQMKYVVDDKTYWIDPHNIKSVAIDYDYDMTNMPMVFATLSIDLNLIDIMVKNKDVGIIIMEIKSCIINSDMPDLFTDYISDRFMYIMTEDVNKDKDLDYEGQNQGREDIFKIIVVGMMPLDCINNNKKLVNAVLNGDLESCLYNTLKGRPILMEKPSNNVFIQERYLPPRNSTAKNIEYIDNLYTIYDTSYRFFLDFDCTYLLSSSGKPIKKRGETITDVMLVIKKGIDRSSKTQGMEINEEQMVYLIYYDSQDVALADNREQNKKFSKIGATITEGEQSKLEVTTVTPRTVLNTNKMRTVRVTNDNIGVVRNQLRQTDLNSVQIVVQKTDIDTSVLTINKKYTIKADDVYDPDTYNGGYLLSHKRELYIREDDLFTLNVMLHMKKLPA